MSESATSFVERIEAMRPLIEANAESGEAQRRTPPPVVEALVDAGLFKLWVPEAYGGSALALPDSLRIFEAVAAIDGSTGWTVAIGTGGGLFAGFLGPGAAAEVFSPREAVIAGSGAPGGSARVVPGGYRASGRWKYASGAHHATWFTANCIIEGAGEPDAPVIRAMAFPAGEVEIVETWDTVGMRATGSHDFAVRDRFVPAERSFSVFADAPAVDHPLYRFPFLPIAAPSFGAVGLGIGRHALTEFHSLAQDKRPSGSSVVLAANAQAQVAFAEAEVLVRSASAFLHGTAEQSWALVSAGALLDAPEQSICQLAGANAARSAARAANLLWEIAGMSPLPFDAPLGRCWRDAHTLTQNLAVSAFGLAEAGSVLLNEPLAARTGAGR